MSRLLSIEEVAQETNLEESQLRFYESEYRDALPAKVRRGGALLFAEGAVAAFRGIHARHLGGDPRPAAAHQPSRYARVIAITSGKGGVGKSNLALNLAIEFQRLGKMAVVLDADLGLANIHLLAGLTPNRGVKELLRAGSKISEVLTPGPEGIAIVSGGSGIISLADSSPLDRLLLVNALAELEQAADLILVDTAAGMGAGVRDFLLAADEVLFVLTPDITSLADAYGLLKALHQQGFRLPIHVVVNMVQTIQQAADVARRFESCARQFLGLAVNCLGYLLRDSTVGLAIARRQPYTVLRPEARVSKNTRALAAALLPQERPETRQYSAFKRYQTLLRERQAAAPGGEELK